MPESTPTCRIHEKNRWIKCQNPALPGDPDGLCILHSRDENKDPEAFKAALQARWSRADQKSYDFRGVFFPGRFDPDDFFGSREFNKPVDFSLATFTEWAYFLGATFTKLANFTRVTFTEGAFFYEASFTEGVDFSEASFTEGAYFYEASFTKRADFSGATFTKGAHFPGATFTERPSFAGATIGGQVVFQEINPPKGSEPPPPAFEADFGDLRFQEQGRLVFQDVSLAHCAFRGTDLRRLELQHVTWGSLGGRQIIYDEVKLREDEKKNPWLRKWFRSRVLPWLAFHAPYEPPPETPWGDRYGEVERLYRYLKINYLSEHDYKNAGDFHYGEMEMHRRANPWRWVPLYWYNLYKFLSGYGERPLRALGLLAVLLVGMAAIVQWLGLEVGKPPHTYIAGFGDSFIYLLQKVTLQRPAWADPVGFWGKLAAGLSVLLIPGQAALFLLALRNRLGRRR